MAADDKWQDTIAEIIAKTWSDPAFKARVKSDAAAVMRDYGLDVPAGLTVRVHENTPTVSHVVLPMKPDNVSIDSHGFVDDQHGHHRFFNGDGCAWEIYH